MLNQIQNAFYAASRPLETAQDILVYYVWGTAKTPCNTVGQIASVIAMVGSGIFALQKNQVPAGVKYAVCGLSVSCLILTTALRRQVEKTAALLNDVNDHKNKLRVTQLELASANLDLEEKAKNQNKSFEDFAREFEAFLGGLEGRDIEKEKVDAICQVIQAGLAKVPTERHAEVAKILEQEASALEKQVLEMQTMIGGLIEARQEASDASDDVEKQRDSLRQYANKIMDIVRKLEGLPDSEIKKAVQAELLQHSQNILTGRTD